MKKESLGIYFNSDGIAVAKLEGKDNFSTTFLPYSSLSEELVLKDANLKIKTEALLKRVLREVDVTNIKHAHISITDKRTIFRYLTLPSLTNKELKLALPIEAEKYIPFKIENISWNYTKTSLYREKKVRVAFLGIKRDFMSELIEIINNIGLGVKSIESSSFATLSALLKLKKISKKEKNYVVFIVSKEDGELTIFCEKFPYFSRYTKLPLTAEGVPDVSKISKEIRLTLDYYKREYKSKKLSRLFLIGKKEYLEYYSSLSDAIDLEMKNIAVEDLLGDKVSTLAEVKAYYTGLYKQRAKDVNIDLKKEMEAKEKKSEKDQEKKLLESGNEAPLRILPLVIILAVGILIGVAFVIEANRRALPQKDRREELLSSLADTYDTNVEEIKRKNLSLEKLNKKNTELIREYNKLKAITNIDKRTTSIISFVLDRLTEGMWFKDIRLKKDNKLKDYSISLKGYIYLDSAQEESSSLNRFISRLKQSDFLGEEDKRVELSFARRDRIRGFDVTSFELTIK